MSLTSQNLNQNPRTLLPKFYGLYCIQSGGINIRLVVMNNVLPRCVKMHHKYDLKGSTYKRRASRKEREKACPTFKDLDFQDMHEEGFYFDTETYNNLMKTLQRDCRVCFIGVPQAVRGECPFVLYSNVLTRGQTGTSGHATSGWDCF